MNLAISGKDKKIVEEAISKIPSIKKILSETIDSTSSEKSNQEYLKTHLGKVIVDLEHTAYEIYRQYEENAFSYMIEAWVKKNKDHILNLRENLGNLDFAKEICMLSYPLARSLEFRVGQMRKSRGGKSFERIVEVLLRRAGIACERPKGKARKILKRIDLVVPDQHTALTRPDQAFFLSCKRTLRERWKQTIPERKPSWRVFLLTIDASLPEEKAKEIDQLGIIAYVRDNLKSKSHLVEKDWIRKLSDLPQDLR